MQRIQIKNINTPKYFDNVWQDDNYQKFDLERQKIFLAYINEGDKVVDLGCGKYGFVELYCKAELQNIKPVELHALDFSSYAIKDLTEKYPVIAGVVADVCKTPYINDYFDLVGTGEVIEHLEKPASFVKEMARITKPGGYMILSTLNDKCEQASKLEYPEHVYSFTPVDLFDFFAPFCDDIHYFIFGNYYFVIAKKKGGANADS